MKSTVLGLFEFWDDVSYRFDGFIRFARRGGRFLWRLTVIITVVGQVVGCTMAIVLHSRTLHALAQVYGGLSVAYADEVAGLCAAWSFLVVLWLEIGLALFGKGLFRNGDLHH